MPNKIWKIPANIIIVKAISTLFSALLADTPAKTVAITTVIGPVGPEICEGVPPKRAAKKPTKIAPYNPAIAPAPEETPKASARGKATTAAVMPPKRSPRMFFECNPLTSCIKNLNNFKVKIND